jgi:HK97 family phage prohead protease
MRAFKVFVPQLKAARTDDGRRTLHGVMSSTIKDLHGDVMTLSALQDMERSARGKTFFLNHSYTVPEDVGGTITDIELQMWPDGTGADLPITVEVNEVNPRAVQAHESIENGTGLGISIGAVIPEGGAKRDKKAGGFIIEHVELLEASLVGIPANPRSWVEYAVKALNGIEDLEITEEWDPDDGQLDAVEPEITDAAEPVETPVELDVEASPEADAAVGDGAGLDAEDTLEAFITEVANESPALDDIDPTPQDAPVSIPEDEGGELPEAVTASAEEALVGIAPLVLSSLTNGNALLAAITSELVELRRDKATAERERDEAVALAQRALADTASILETLAATPAGRRAVVRESSTKFEHLSGVYSETFLKMLRG